MLALPEIITTNLSIATNGDVDGLAAALRADDAMLL